MLNVVYFTTKSGNTRRLVERLGVESTRIPYTLSETPAVVTQPYILITPTYGGGYLSGAVPKPVIRFLNNVANRELMCGVIATGNTNFGTAFCSAGRVIAQKCNVPELARVEMFGTPEDVQRIQQILTEFHPNVA